MSAGTEKIAWDKIHEAMATLEMHLELASNHPGVLTPDKRRELEQRLEMLRAKIAPRATNPGSQTLNRS
jgi:hypothetical protein